MHTCVHAFVRILNIFYFTSNQMSVNQYCYSGGNVASLNTEKYFISYNTYQFKRYDIKIYF